MPDLDIQRPVDGEDRNLDPLEGSRRVESDELEHPWRRQLLERLLLQ